MVPPFANPTRARAAAIAAANADKTSSADRPLGVGAHENENRGIALIAQHRWENEGGALDPGARGLDRASTPN